MLGLYNSVDRTTLAAWQTATGQDATSLNTDPLFINPTGDAVAVSLHVQPGSPANNGGTPISGLTTDYDGQARSVTFPDIGADEVISNNANLSALVLSSGALTPAFSGAATSYTATVSNATTALTATPTLADANATVTVNGAAVPSGSASGAINLNVGSSTINVDVTAQDLTTTKTYTVTVTRLSVFQEWAAANGVTNDPQMPGANGIGNLLNFAFGVDPVTGGSGALVFNGTFGAGGTIGTTGQPITMLEPTANGVDFRALFVRRRDFAAAGLTYKPQFSASMASWTDSAVVPTVLADDGANQIVSVPYPPFIGGKKARFFRISVSMAP
ncbi:MAG: cadherin-like beta sandwich domain-containing protein [Chthoniobacteraceae bacterium]